MKLEREELDNFLQRTKGFWVNPMEIITSYKDHMEELDYFYENADQELLDNLLHMATVLHKIRNEYKKPMQVVSGFRNLDHNKKVGGAPNSLHCKGLAVDFKDPKGDLDYFFFNNQASMLDEFGASIESPRYTKGWCHFQLVRPASNKSIFRPYTREPKASELDRRFEFLVKNGL